MDILVYALAFIGAVIFMFMYHKWNFKRNLMGSNTYMQSAATTKMIEDMERAELKAQEERLMGNKRYRVLKSILQDEVSAIQDLSLSEAKYKLPAGQSERIIDHPEFKVVVRLNTELESPATGAVKVTVYPKRILGIWLAAEEWVYYKANSLGKE